jgi:hypothetical protein
MQRLEARAQTSECEQMPPTADSRTEFCILKAASAGSGAFRDLWWGVVSVTRTCRSPANSSRAEHLSEARLFARESGLDWHLKNLIGGMTCSLMDPLDCFGIRRL